MPTNGRNNKFAKVAPQNCKEIMVFKSIWIASHGKVTLRQQSQQSLILILLFNGWTDGPSLFGGFHQMS
jgi:hypothetical protein